MNLFTAAALILILGILYGLCFLIGEPMLDQAIQNHRLIQKYRKEHPDENRTER